MIRAARTVHLACSDPGYSDPRAFRAPDWSVAIPDGSGGACECFASSNNRRRSVGVGHGCERRERISRNEGRKHERN